MKHIMSLCVVLVCLSSLWPQQPPPATDMASATVPPLINFSGVLTDLNGKPVTGIVGVTFLLYKDSQAGAPLWLETQNVQPDKTGHYSVTLGSTTTHGLPPNLFVAGETRWLGVEIQGQPEQARVLLVSAPYAMKAADAQTLGGLPPSAFVLAAPAAGGSQSFQAAASPTTSNGAPPPNSTVTGLGVVNTIPLWDTTSDIINSVVTQTGSGSTARIGINTATPAATLDVKGAGTFRGALALPSLAAATTTAGSNSQPLNLIASAYNSSTAGPVNQTLRFQAEPAGNNSATPGATLNLLYASGNAAPTETGFSIAKNGLINFALGQTFPGAGTITGVTASSGLTGGGTSGTVTLGIDTTAVPQLHSINTFTSNQVINGTLGLNSPAGTVFKVQSTSAGTHAPLAQFGSAGANDANSIRVYNGGTAGPYTEMFAAATGTFVPGTLAGDGGVRVAPGRNLWLGDSGLTRMVLTSAGDVGVGTSVPGAQMDVESTAYNVPGLKVVGGNAAVFSTLQGSDGIDAYAGKSDDAVATNGASGVVGFGGESGNIGGVGVVGNGGGGGAFGGAVTAGDGVQGYGATGSAADLHNSFGGNGGTFIGGGALSGYDCCDGIGMYATTADGPGVNSSVAGYFVGDVAVSGAISAGTKDFRIDHPFDPANKYLYHSSVESSEMMNIYTGNATTDTNGVADIQLPDWFEAINRDFRYQLTVIGQFAQAIVSHEVENNHFQIRTNQGRVKVSWQITAVRNDRYAQAHPLVVEKEKNPRERGTYIHPELYGAPEEKSEAWARQPGVLNRVKAMRAKAAEQRAANASTRKPDGRESAMPHQ